jgi:tetratricopeptide (TPR) repeat protein
MWNRPNSRCLAIPISSFFLLHTGISDAAQMYYCGHGNLDDRIASCTEILTEDGHSYEDYARAYDGRCWALNLKGLYKEAIPDCLKAIKFNPKYHYAYNNLGVALEGRGRYSEAFTEYTKAIQLHPNFKAAQENLSRVSTMMSNSPRYPSPTDVNTPASVPPQSNPSVRSSACQKYPDLC